MCIYICQKNAGAWRVCVPNWSIGYMALDQRRCLTWCVFMFGRSAGLLRSTCLYISIPRAIRDLPRRHEEDAGPSGFVLQAYLN